MLGSAGLVIHSSFAIDDVIKSYFFIPYEKSSGKIEPLLGVGWTLVFEMFFYIVFTIALFLRANPYLFVGSVLAVFSVLSTLRPEQHPVWMYLFDPIVLEFFFGMIVGYFTLKERFLGLQLAIIIAVASILSLVLLPGFGYSRVVVAGLPATLLIYSCVSIEPYLRDRIPRVLLYFGAASYSLYLFHPLFLPAVPLLLHKMQLQIVPLSVALCIISALSLAAIVYRFIELPITHAFRRLPFVAGYSHKSVTEIK
jgi:peptidoglycan/LPS O-acetylase OafA/YrhL